MHTLGVKHGDRLKVLEVLTLRAAVMGPRGAMKAVTQAGFRAELARRSTLAGEVIGCSR